MTHFRIFAFLLIASSTLSSTFKLLDTRTSLPGEDSEWVAGRISGGDLAFESQFPYQAGLSIEYLVGQYTWCGGSLIADRWILTAAHCVDNVVRVIVYLGSVKRLQPAKTIHLTASNIYVHAEWNRARLEHDIALLELPSAVKYSDAIHPISLPKLLTPAYSAYTYREALTSGWGAMNDDSGTISNELRYIVRYIASNAECQYVYGTAVRSTNICMDTTGGKSTCTGDSGGPLAVHDDETNDMVLIGLTSFGKSSGCTKGYPAVFTRVTSYLKWIYETSGVYH